MSRIFLHFSLFVVLSLLLHLGVFFYFATREEEPLMLEITPTPFFVDLRAAEQRPRELDVPVPQQITPRTQAARRLAEADQVVDRETAPQGRDSRDPNPVPLPQEAQRDRESAPPLPSEVGTIPSLSKKDLLLSAKNAAQSVANLDPEINRKIQRDLEEGRAVWLDTEKDLLGSFYKRFRNAVEDVWDYPKEAIARGEFGVCLYRIEINRAGVLINEPELLKSSGSAGLDAEAARAVVAASPRFGFLPDAYRYESLTIFVYFDYRLGSRRVYGERFY